MTSGVLIHGKPLFEECEEMFGDIMEEGSKIKEFIANFMTTKCDKPEDKSLRELLQRFHDSLPVPKVRKTQSNFKFSLSFRTYIVLQNLHIK